MIHFSIQTKYLLSLYLKMRLTRKPIEKSPNQILLANFTCLARLFGSSFVPFLFKFDLGRLDGMAKLEYD